MTPELKKIIETIPGELGWFHLGNQRAFETVADDLLTLGVGPSTVGDLLTSAYSAVAGEFGE